MKTYCIAVPIVATTVAEAIEQINKFNVLANWVHARYQSVCLRAEFRLDLLADITVSGLRQMLRAYQYDHAIVDRAIITCRDTSEGGKHAMADELKANLRSRQWPQYPYAVDFEYAMLSAIYVDGPPSFVLTDDIISWHGDQFNSHTINRMVQWLAQNDRCDVVLKVAIKGTASDSLGLLQKMFVDIPAIWPTRSTGKLRVVPIVIGECTLTREWGPLLGGAFTFAALEQGKESAPGQMAVRDLLTLWQTLGSIQVKA